MYKVKTIDQFPLTALATDFFELTNQEAADAILVRSSKIPNNLIRPELLAIARAGSGVNTINLAACTKNGTVVFNTPGANANAVKELIIQCLFRCVRPLNSAIKMTANLQAKFQEDLQVLAESQRKNYLGHELYGKTIGILGLGMIGQRLAETCYQLGMQVIGYNRSFKSLPHILQLPKIEEILALADFVVILLPLTDQTRHFLTNRHFKLMKKTAFLLNFGRNQIVDNQALLTALANNEFAGYITDFPKTELQNQPKITLLPHLGGNTAEALTSSTNLALQSLLNFLASGTIQQAVNFPAVDLPFDSPQRITLYFANHQTLWNAITQTLSSYGLPINEMAGNTTKEGYSYSLINTDLSACNLQQILQLPTDLAKIPGMIRVRLLDSPANIIQTSN